MGVQNNGAGGERTWAQWCAQTWQSATQTVTAAANLTGQAAHGAVDITRRVYDVAIDVAPSVYDACQLAVGKIQSAASSTAGAVGTAARIGRQILSNLDAAVDQEDRVQQLEIDQRVKDCYHKVQPEIVDRFYQRFGCKTMLQLERFTHEIQDHIPGMASVVINRLVKPETVRVDLQTIALGTTSWVANKIERIMPNGDKEARNRLAASLAQDAEPLIQTFEKAATKTKLYKKKGWEDKDFATQYNEILSGTDIARELDHPKDFYDRLAARLLKRLERELPEEMEPHLRLAIEAALEGLQTACPDKKREALASLLMQLHQKITDPIQIKKWLMILMNSTSESMEDNYRSFMRAIDSASWWIPLRSFFDTPGKDGPKRLDNEEEFDPAYGKTIMSLLQMLQPKAMGIDALPMYAILTKGDFKKGEDLLSVIIRNATGASIESKMAPDTDEWVKETIHITKNALFERDGNFISRPGHISEIDWNALTKDEKLLACNENSELYKCFKQRHIAHVDAEFLKSTTRLTKSILKAGLIVDQFLPGPMAVAKDKSENWFIRGLAGIGAFIRELPIIHLIFNSFHRLSILIRELIADKGSEATAKSLDERLDVFLKTKSVDMMAMYMIESIVTKLELIDPEDSQLETLKIAAGTKATKADEKAAPAVAVAVVNPIHAPIVEEVEDIAVADAVEDTSVTVIDEEEDEEFFDAIEGEAAADTAGNTEDRNI